MLYLFSGDQFKEIKKHSQVLIEGFVSQKPSSSLLYIDEENFGEYDISCLAKEQGLFEKQLIVVLSYVLSDSVWEEIENKIEDLSESKNIFIFVEGILGKKVKDKISKFSKDSKSFSNSSEEKKYNPFLMTNAYGERNRKKLWLLFQQAISGGLAPEEIQGLLFWQVKSMLIAKLSKTPAESDLKPFVFQKSKKFAENFSEEELKKHSSELVEIYHNVRKGKGDLATSLEKFILSI